jgi:hypothetical protein
VTTAPAFAILTVGKQPRSELVQRRKILLFHAIRPIDRDDDWERFLQETALLDLPPEGEQLAPHIWLFPDDGTAYLRLSRIGHQLGIATRVLPFFPSSGWQPLSRPP